LRTEDGGLTWTAQSSGTMDWLGGVAFSSAERGWVVSGNGVLKTEDAGRHWETRLTLLFFERLRGVLAAGDVVIAVGLGGRFGHNALILQSSDRGDTWQAPSIQLPCGSDAGLWGVVLLQDSLTSVAVGFEGHIARSVDGGASWIPRLTCPVRTASSVSLVDEKKGWVAGYFGIHHTEDGGSTWIQQAPEGGRAVLFIDAEHGWVADNRGSSILRTTDGGANWEHHPSGVNTFLYSLSFCYA